MARGYKTFFKLNLVEHEICPANKSQITNNCKFLLAKHSEHENFSADHENFSANKYKNANYSWPFWYLLAGKISCSAEFSMKNNFGPEEGGNHLLTFDE